MEAPTCGTRRCADPTEIDAPHLPMTRLAREFSTANGQLIQTLIINGRSFSSAINADAPTGDPLDTWWRAYLRGDRPTSNPPAVAPPIRVGEMFCGPGGLALGFRQAAAELGLRWISAAAVDTDAEAVELYRRHNETRHGSTRSASMLVDHQVAGEGNDARFLYPPEVIDPGWEAHASQLDVLLAGPPCQGHSNLNNKTRRTDPRNELYLTVPAMAVATGARAVIIENVRAAVHDQKQVVQSTVRLLEDAGFHVEQGVVAAADLGWPQRRERWMVVATRPGAPLPLSDVSAALASPARPITWAIGDLEDEIDGFMARQSELSEENVKRIRYLFENDAHDLPNHERPTCHQKGTTYNSVYGRLHGDQPSPTITTGFMTPGRGRYIHPTRERVLSPHEAARIQGFPDTYDFRPDPPNEPSRAKLAKWIGDAVPMPIGYAASLSALSALINSNA